MASGFGSNTHTSSAGSRRRSEESHCPSFAPTSTTHECEWRNQSGKSENLERSIAVLTPGAHAETQEAMGEDPWIAAKSRCARTTSRMSVGTTLLSTL